MNMKKHVYQSYNKWERKRLCKKINTSSLYGKTLTAIVYPMGSYRCMKVTSKMQSATYSDNLSEYHLYQPKLKDTPKISVLAEKNYILIMDNHGTWRKNRTIDTFHCKLSKCLSFSHITPENIHYFLDDLLCRSRLDYLSRKGGDTYDKNKY